MFRVAFCKDRLNAQPCQDAARIVAVVPAIALKTIRPLSRTTTPSFHGRDIDGQGDDLHHVGSVRRGHTDGKGNTLGVRDHMVLRARFCPIRGIWPCFFASSPPPLLGEGLGVGVDSLIDSKTID